MTQLDYLEAKIIDTCNYRCKACIPFSNIAKSGSYDLFQYQKDLKKISMLFDYIKDFRILGGEPLLSKNLLDYLQIARELLTQSNIYIVTNGLLLDRLTEPLKSYIKTHDICFFVSVYPDQNRKDHVLAQVTRLKNEGFKVDHYQANFFCTNHQFEDNRFNSEETYRICRQIVDCTNIYNGKIYACPKPFSIVHYNKRFKTNYNFDDDGIDIYQNTITGDEIKKMLLQPMSACQYCSPERGFIKWKSEPDVSCYDWSNDSRNSQLITDQSSEQEIDEIFQVTAFLVSRQETGSYEYAIRQLNLNLSVLKQLGSGILIVGSDYSPAICEIVKVAFMKTKFQVTGIVHTKNIHQYIFNSQSIDMDIVYRNRPSNILVLESSTIKGMRLAKKIRDSLTHDEK